MKDQLESLVTEMIKKGILFTDAVTEFEKKFIKQMLDKNKGNHSKAAVELGIHRNTLSRKVDEVSLLIDWPRRKKRALPLNRWRMPSDKTQLLPPNIQFSMRHANVSRGPEGARRRAGIGWIGSLTEIRAGARGRATGNSAPCPSILLACRRSGVMYRAVNGGMRRLRLCLGLIGNRIGIKRSIHRQHQAGSGGVRRDGPIEVHGVARAQIGDFGLRGILHFNVPSSGLGFGSVEDIDPNEVGVGSGILFNAVHKSRQTQPFAPSKHPRFSAPFPAEFQRERHFIVSVLVGVASLDGDFHRRHFKSVRGIYAGSGLRKDIRKPLVVTVEVDVGALEKRIDVSAGRVLRRLRQGNRAGNVPGGAIEIRRRGIDVGQAQTVEGVHIGGVALGGGLKSGDGVGIILALKATNPMALLKSARLGSTYA